MFDQRYYNPQQFTALRCANAPALLARSAEHACLLEVFSDEFGASTATQGQGDHRSLRAWPRDEGFTDLYHACVEYRR
jgi:hypothetical protein